LTKNLYETRFGPNLVMQPLKLSQDVVPIGEFKSNAADWLRRLKSDCAPVVITQNGRPAAVMISPAEYDRIRDQVRFLESVTAGLADADAGRTMSTPQLKKRLKSRQHR
jgi:prevent-host-death family protein